MNELLNAAQAGSVDNTNSVSNSPTMIESLTCREYMNKFYPDSIKENNGKLECVDEAAYDAWYDYSRGYFLNKNWHMTSDEKVAILDKLCMVVPMSNIMLRAVLDGFDISCLVDDVKDNNGDINGIITAAYGCMACLSKLNVRALVRFSLAFRNTFSNNEFKAASILLNNGIDVDTILDKKEYVCNNARCIVDKYFDNPIPATLLDVIKKGSKASLKDYIFFLDYCDDVSWLDERNCKNFRIITEIQNGVKRLGYVHERYKNAVLNQSEAYYISRYPDDTEALQLLKYGFAENLLIVVTYGKQYLQRCLEIGAILNKRIYDHILYNHHSIHYDHENHEEYLDALERFAKAYRENFKMYRESFKQLSNIISEHNESLFVEKIYLYGAGISPKVRTEPLTIDVCYSKSIYNKTNWTYHSDRAESSIKSVLYNLPTKVKLERYTEYEENRRYEGLLIWEKDNGYLFDDIQ